MCIRDSIFGLFTLVADVLVRVERIDTSGGNLIFRGSAFEQWFTLQQVSFAFLFVVPLFIGIATLVVPLQIGAPSVAFPRAAAAALWTWAIAAITMVATWAIDGGLIDRNVDVINEWTQLTMLAFAAVIAALLAASMVLITTIFTERSQGMSLYNVPLFTWSMLVACAIWLLSLPVLFANLIVMWLDARGALFHSFGGDALWEQVNWAVQQPQVFAYAIPVLGMIGEVIPVSVGRRLKLYDVAMVAIGAFGAFTFGAYAQTWAREFFPELALANPNTSWLFVLGSLALVVPLLAMMGTVGFTIASAERAPTVTGHLALAAMSLVTLLVAGLLGAVRVLGNFVTPIFDFIALDGAADWLRRLYNVDEGNTDVAVIDSSLAGGVTQVAIAAGLLAAMSGLWYWAPKIFGRTLPTGLAMLAGVSVLGGAVVSGGADAISGFLGQPDSVTAVDQSGGIETFNLISTIGSVGILAGFGLTVLAVVVALLPSRGDDAEADEDNDPWGGHTLEWLTASPPVPGNFAGPLVVTSEAPLLDDDFENPYAEATA